MVVAVEILDMPISFILLHHFVELITRYKLDDLREYKLTLIHNLDALNNKTNKSISNQKINGPLYLIKY